MPSPEFKKLSSILLPGSKHWVGNGFPVRNYFPSNPLGPQISPFILLDYAGPYDFSPSETRRGVGEHPHRGFETVTLMYQGKVAHRDSAGAHGVIGPGDVQWMTAGSGVVHEEMHEENFGRRGGVFEAIQLWVNLPRQHKMDPPRYQDIPKTEIPILDLENDAGTLRPIAGRFAGHTGPAQTHTPVNLWDLHLKKGAKLTLDFLPGYTTALFVLSGKLKNKDGKALAAAQLGLFSQEETRLQLEVQEETRALLMNGERISDPVVQQGPFVMNTHEEIIQAIRDYQEGRMGHLDRG